MHLILYDGVCALCHWFVRWVLRHDARGAFRFAPLQGELAARLLGEQHPRHDLRTVYVVANYDTPAQQWFTRGEAVRFVLRATRPLGLGWRLIHMAARCMPKALLNLGYDFVAAVRYRWFGKYEVCPVPDAAHRDRFL